MQSELDSQLARHKGKGLSAAVIIPEREIWLGTSGVSYGEVPIAPDMLFAIGSITKNVVAALALSLAEDGILSLEDPLAKWLPAYSEVDGSITLRQLLNHTSGVFQFFSNPKIWKEMERDPARLWTPEQVLSYLHEPYFAPGKGFRYSNTNYVLLGMVLQRAIGSPISAELRRRFWQPLGLRNAYVYMEERLPANLAHVWETFRRFGQQRDLTFLPRMAHESIIHPSGGIFMTAVELSKWCDALFQGKVISRASLDQMMAFVETPKGHLPDTDGYGLGLQSHRSSFSHGERAIGHSGASIGTIAYMIYLPKHRVAVAAMENSANGKCIREAVRGLIRVVIEELPLKRQ